jgi:hypothetical protein
MHFQNMKAKQEHRQFDSHAVKTKSKEQKTPIIQYFDVVCMLQHYYQGTGTEVIKNLNDVNQQITCTRFVLSAIPQKLGTLFTVCSQCLRA